MAFRFETLDTWKMARAFSAQVFNATTRFPQRELYGLTSQMTRAADAVVLLIAEGSGLPSKALFQHRLGLAVAELYEVASGCFLALDRGYLSTETHRDLYGAADGLARRIRRLKDAVGR